MVYDSWPKVFKLAVKVAKEIRAKNAKLTVAQSTKMAYKTPEVMKAKKEYGEYKKKKGGSTKKPPATRKRRAPAKK